MQTYTSENAANNGCSWGVRGQEFRISQLVARIALTFCLQCEKFARKNILYANLYQLSPMESTGTEDPNDT